MHQVLHRAGRLVPSVDRLLSEAGYFSLPYTLCPLRRGGSQELQFVKRKR